MRNSTLLKKAIAKGLKICFFDIETSPLLVWTYVIRDAYIPHDSIEQNMAITSLAYMFEGDKAPTAFEWDWCGDKGIDYCLLNRSVTVLNKADLVIGQNSDRFDITTLQWRLNLNKLPSLENVVSLDTLKLSRKVFRAESQKLDYRSSVYGFGGKIKQDMQDCIAVAKGDKKKQALRVKYNIKDVIDLRKIFWRELDYYQLPKSILKMLKEYTKEERPFCIKCAAKRQKRFEISKTRHKKQNKLKCDNCGYIWRPKK